MDENLKNLEVEIEKEITSIFGHSNAFVPAPNLERTKLSVRHELNEQWLSARAAMPIPSKAIARTKSAVRNELRRWPIEPTTTSAGSGTSRFGSFIAAAAVILLCIGLVQHAASLKPSSTRLSESLALFDESSDTALQEDLLTTIASDLAAMEESLEMWREESSDWDTEEIEGKLF